MQNSSKIILGIDPGTVIMGYGLIKLKGKQMELLEMGTLKLSAKLDSYEKLKRIQQKITEIIRFVHSFGFWWIGNRLKGISNG